MLSNQNKRLFISIFVLYILQLLELFKHKALAQRNTHLKTIYSSTILQGIPYADDLKREIQDLLQGFMLGAFWSYVIKESRMQLNKLYIIYASNM